jgi:hypothetical protein
MSPGRWVRMVKGESALAVLPILAAVMRMNGLPWAVGGIEMRGT